MCESVYVLVDIDKGNKICYVEKKNFAMRSKRANQAKLEYAKLICEAGKKDT